MCICPAVSLLLCSMYSVSPQAAFHTPSGRSPARHALELSPPPLSIVQGPHPCNTKGPGVRTLQLLGNCPQAHSASGVAGHKLAPPTPRPAGTGHRAGLGRLSVCLGWGRAHQALVPACTRPAARDQCMADWTRATLDPEGVMPAACRWTASAEAVRQARLAAAWVEQTQCSQAQGGLDPRMLLQGSWPGKRCA